LASGRSASQACGKLSGGPLPVSKRHRGARAGGVGSDRAQFPFIAASPNGSGLSPVPADTAPPDSAIGARLEGSALAMSRLLVTGSSGEIGRRVVALQARGRDCEMVAGIDTRKPAPPP